MADNNVVTLVGTLGADPEVRRTPTGKDVVAFSLVTNDRIRNADGSWTEGQASWFRVSAWNALGRNAAMSFRKGQRVIVRGALRVEQWQGRDGGTGKTVALTAFSLGHDLLWGTSTFARSTPPQQREPSDGWGERTDPPVEDPSETEPAQEARVAAPTPVGWGAQLPADDETPF